NGDISDGDVLMKVMRCEHIASISLQSHLDDQRAPLVDCRNMHVRVENFDFRVCFDLARQHLPRNATFNAKRLGSCAVQLERNPFQVEDDISSVFDDARYRREFMQHTLYLDSRYGCALDRREQSTPQTVS